jgi:hypothetical protein
LNEALSQILQVISDPPPALIEDSGFGFQLLTIPLDPRRDHHPAPSGPSTFALRASLASPTAQQQNALSRTLMLPC